MNRSTRRWLDKELRPNRRPGIQKIMATVKAAHPTRTIQEIIEMSKIEWSKRNATR